MFNGGHIAIYFLDKRSLRSGVQNDTWVKVNFSVAILKIIRLSTFRPSNILTLKKFETVHLSNFRPSTCILLDRLFLLLKIFGPPTFVLPDCLLPLFQILRPSTFIFEHFEIDWYLKNRNYDEINDFNEFYDVVTLVINIIFE